MKLENLEMTIIKSKEGYTAFLTDDNLSGVITHAQNLEDIPARLSDAFRVMLEYSFSEKNYTIINTDK